MLEPTLALSSTSILVYYNIVTNICVPSFVNLPHKLVIMEMHQETQPTQHIKWYLYFSMFLLYALLLVFIIENIGSKRMHTHNMEHKYL